MSLLKKFSKSTQDLREKKKWRISTLKPRKKEHVRTYSRDSKTGIFDFPAKTLIFGYS